MTEVRTQHCHCSFISKPISYTWTEQFPSNYTNYSGCCPLLSVTDNLNGLDFESYYQLEPGDGCAHPAVSSAVQCSAGHHTRDVKRSKWTISCPVPSPAQAVLCLELLNIDIDKKTIHSSEKMQRGSLKTEKVLVCKLLVPVLSAFVYSSSKNWGTLNITSQDGQSWGHVSAAWRTAGCPQLSLHQPAAAPCP